MCECEKKCVKVYRSEMSVRCMKIAASVKLWNYNFNISDGENLNELGHIRIASRAKHKPHKQAVVVYAATDLFLSIF